MITGFRDKATEQIFSGLFVRFLPEDVQKRALRKLQMIHAAAELRDLLIPPANRLEALRGTRRGQYSIRVNDQWRIFFRWQAGHAFDVELVDYH